MRFVRPCGDEGALISGRRRANILLSELGEHEDAQGHLKRALAQFFLTNNTLVSFGLGILFAALMCVLCPSWAALGRFGVYGGLLGICLVITYRVAVIRFATMAKSLWAARRRRFRSGAADRAKTERGEEEGE
jgi:hypothetical protein